MLRDGERHVYWCRIQRSSNGQGAAAGGILSLTFTRIDSKISNFKKQSVQVLGFEWENCGKPDAPAVLKTLSVAPDPISIPGKIIAEASGQSAVLLDSPLPLNVTVEKEDCPEPLHSYGLPCRCPFKPGLYSLPQSDFYIPDVELPSWLTNGHYRAQGVLGKQDSELGCLKMVLALHSN
ncbi:hypothetical protein WMY93_011118 [Mugilogobius chulae]|uniref:MD-2-related lipid-recognition domain-containing protein n=1 Tax=Mugilogobius chulae TaxID=88201 RepID=A0AAW0P122_9GOBI